MILRMICFIVVCPPLGHWSLRRPLSLRRLRGCFCSPRQWFKRLILRIPLILLGVSFRLGMHLSNVIRSRLRITTFVTMREKHFHVHGNACTCDGVVQGVMGPAPVFESTKPAHHRPAKKMLRPRAEMALNSKNAVKQRFLCLTVPFVSGILWGFPHSQW